MMNQKLITSIILAGICVAAQAQKYTGSNFVPPEAGKWYRLETCYTGDDNRKGTCIQYFESGKKVENGLYAALPLDDNNPESDAQNWKFENNPDGSETYALINRTARDGYLSTIPVLKGEQVTSGTQLGPECNWVYVPEETTGNPTDKYGFIFVGGDEMSGVDHAGNSYAGISTTYIMDLVDDNTSRNIYMNTSREHLGYAINLWSDANDEKANEWLFSLVPGKTDTPSAVEVISVPEEQESQQSPVIYNLQGQRIDNPVGGIYIINGAKVLIRR